MIAPATTPCKLAEQNKLASQRLRGCLWGAAVALHRSPVFNLTEAGERMRVPSDMRYTSVTAFLLRDWVEPELRELGRLLSPGDVFVDVGANIGLYTLKAARLVGPTGRVVAIEPGAEARMQLERNLSLNAFHWVDVLGVALSDADGEAMLHHVDLGHDPQAFSLLENLATGGRGETVPTARLDRIVDEQALRRLDLIKIDVEGAEPLVLAGAEGALARFRPRIIFECNAYANAREATARAWDQLAALGYRFKRLQDGRFEPLDHPPEDFCNVVATPLAS